MPQLPPSLLALLRHQDGVVSRRQAVDLGHDPGDLRRWCRQRLLRGCLPGVYLDHTGPPTWRQRAWAAVLSVEPAALFGPSALRAVAGPGLRGHDDRGPVHVAVDHRRTVTGAPGVRVHRVRRLEATAQWQTSPPRVRLEDAVLDIASAARTDSDAVAALAGAVSGRLTTAARLRAVLDERTRLPRRRFLAEVLLDVEQGVCSVLEREYLRRVERAHGLPRGVRQAGAHSRGPIYRDVHYPAQDTCVELDGRLDHTSAEDVDADLDRDLDAAVDRQHTVRAGWGQSVGRPCRTAAALGRLLQARGWEGAPTRCPACPELPEGPEGPDRVGSGSPGDSEPTRSTR